MGGIWGVGHCVTLSLYHCVTVSLCYCVIVQFEVCAQALKVLEASKDAKGRTIEVVKLPLPPAMHYTKEEFQGLRPVRTQL